MWPPPASHKSLWVLWWSHKLPFQSVFNLKNIFLRTIYFLFYLWPMPLPCEYMCIMCMQEHRIPRNWSFRCFWGAMCLWEPNLWRQVCNRNCWTISSALKCLLLISYREAVAMWMVSRCGELPATPSKHWLTRKWLKNDSPIGSGQDLTVFY